MKNLELVGAKIFSDAENYWFQLPEKNFLYPTTIRSMKRLFDYARQFPDAINHRTKNIDDAAKEFNRPNGIWQDDTAAMLLKKSLPKKYALPYVAQLIKSPAYPTAFYSKFFNRIRQGEPNFVGIKDINKQISLLICSGYILGVKRELTKEKFRVRSDFGFTLVNGLQMMIHPDEPLFTEVLNL